MTRHFDLDFKLRFERLVLDHYGHYLEVFGISFWSPKIEARRQYHRRNWSKLTINSQSLDHWPHCEPGIFVATKLLCQYFMDKKVCPFCGSCKKSCIASFRSSRLVIKMSQISFMKSIGVALGLDESIAWKKSKVKRRQALARL